MELVLKCELGDPIQYVGPYYTSLPLLPLPQVAVILSICISHYESNNTIFTSPLHQLRSG